MGWRCCRCSRVAFVERNWCFQVDLGDPEGLLLLMADVSLRLRPLPRGQLAGVSCFPVCLSVPSGACGISSVPQPDGKAEIWAAKFQQA